jgi:hypothetical protein
MDTYRATNTTNGKFYIGSTTNFERRREEHLRCSDNLPFQNALRKSPEAFEWEVWSDDCDKPILEQALLDMWFGKECCYNINPSASRPPSWGGKTIRWRREQNKVRQPMSYGKTMRAGERERLKHPPTESGNRVAKIKSETQIARSGQIVGT